MTTPTNRMQQKTSTPGAIPRPQTLLTRFLAALIDRDPQRALAVLAAAAERRALPRRLLFGPKLDGGCHHP